MGPDRRFGSFGLCFGPNGRFSTHFGPHLMFLDLTELWPCGRYGPTGPDEPRWKTRWTGIGVRLRYGPIRMGPRRAPTSPEGTQQDPT